MPTITLTQNIQKLEKIFDTFNKYLYNGTLERPVITVQADTTRGAYGWCTCNKRWTAKQGEYYEINICAEYLDRDKYEIAGTLLHEMAHLYANYKGIKDCSRGNTYHNRQYKEIAENHGLTVNHHPVYGWTITELNQRARDIIDSVKSINFDLNRKRAYQITSGNTGNGNGTTPTRGRAPSTHSIKYICPCCNASVRATRHVNVICADCMEQMIEC